MLNNYGFDLWANSYDESVKKAEENNEYPFAGYTSIMNAIYGTIMNEAPAKVLDIGFGTAVLTSKLYEGKNQIFGIDFSSEMIKIAEAKMPDANLIQWDFNEGIPVSFQKEKFDFIVSTYAIHHLNDEAKTNFIIELLELLEEDGILLIGDVCFEDRKEHDLCKNNSGELWDEDEIYIVYSELKDKLKEHCEIVFHKYSFCSGIIEIRKI